MAQNSQTWQLQALLDTYTYSTSASVLTKTFKVPKIHSYSDLRKLAKPHFCSSSSSSSSNSVELAYRKSGTSTVLGFYMKRLLSLAYVILDQENLRNFTRNCIITNFPYLLEAIFCMVTCISRFIKRWGSSARRSAGVEVGWGRANIVSLHRNGHGRYPRH